MSFKFDFGGGKEDSLTESASENDKCESEDNIEWLECEEVIVSSKQIKELDAMIPHAKMFINSEVEIGHIVMNNAILNMNTEVSLNASKLARKENTDLITGKYEGGLKIWECTHDLIEYLVKHEDDIGLNNVKVLDLGCGAGILGIYAFLNGSFVTFQDYNKEVLEYITIPNVLLNIEEEEERINNIQRCQFFSGDWALFNRKLDVDTTYDFIFTSETIYNEKNYDKLIKLFAKRLSEKGTVYVAAKTCYFGVGGGTRQFENVLSKSNLFKHEVCWKNIDGIQREIIKIKKI